MPGADIPPIECLLVDEAQDLRELYVRFINRVTCASSRVALVGDSMQLLYDYEKWRPASSDYMMHPEQHFHFSRPWKNVSLTVSFRLHKGYVRECSGCNSEVYLIVRHRHAHIARTRRWTQTKDQRL